MPTLRLDPPRTKPDPTVDYLALADAAYLAAQVDARAVLAAAEKIVQLDVRIARGREWLRTHPADHPRRREAKLRLLRIENDRDRTAIVLHVREQACRMHVQERFGFEIHENGIAEDMLTSWRELLGDRPVPELTTRVDHTRPTVAAWERDELRETLESYEGVWGEQRWREKQETT